MATALLLIDLQQDFLGRAELFPAASAVVQHAAMLLASFRERSLPVLHAHTLVRPDGSDAMPHWRRAGTLPCVEGTPGAVPPPELTPRAGEPVIRKAFFSAFTDPTLAALLRRQAVENLIIAGIYTHGCVRATVLDAYAAGFNVTVASDAVGSYDALHAEVTRLHLEGRACAFVSTPRILEHLDGTAPLATPRDDSRSGSQKTGDLLPVACIDGRWIPATDHAADDRFDPIDSPRRMARVPQGKASDVDAAATTAARQQPAWAARSAADRVSVLRSWHATLGRHRDRLVTLLAQEIGKPQRDADAEVNYALALLDATVTSLEGDGGAQPDAPFQIRYRPLGVVGVVTPFNNPLALPAGKLAPALAWGNGVVWKPAMQAPRLAMLLMESLDEAGLPPGCVNLVFGTAATAMAVIRHRAVNAVTFTGSIAAGREITAACAARDLPLQAELGGNNAAIVTPACDIDTVAATLAHAAFSFAGQRCTAPRRMIVLRPALAAFSRAFVQAAESLTLGLPTDAATQLGPLVSLEARSRVEAAIHRGIADGGRLLTGGQPPKAYPQGCWLLPTVMTNVPHASPLVQQETFGPVAIISEASDVDDALNQLNGVPHGLVATLYADGAATQDRFLASAQAGILRINSSTPIHPDAPFGGWKASGLGPPEHGRWDRDFYSRPQAVYASGAES